MSKLIDRKRRGRTAPSREKKRALAAWLSRRIDAKVDLRRLDEADLAHLIGLMDGGTDLRTIRAKERDKLEAIIEGRRSCLPLDGVKRMRLRQGARAE